MQIYDNKSANQLVRRVASIPLDEVLGSLHLAKKIWIMAFIHTPQINRNFCCEITINAVLNYALNYIQVSCG